MGFTHFWKREIEISLSDMKNVVDDFRKILPEITKYVQLAGGNGKGEPIISYDKICFNGSHNCGHPKNNAIGIPWPADHAGGIAEPFENVETDTWANGIGTKIEKRVCNGDCAYDTFSFPRILILHDWQKPDTNGLYLIFCKTAFRPYDYAVISFLTIIKHHLQNKIIVTSDSTDRQWFDGKLLCQAILGYGMQYEMVEDVGLVQKMNI